MTNLSLWQEYIDNRMLLDLIASDFEETIQAASDLSAAALELAEAMRELGGAMAEGMESEDDTWLK